MWNQEIVQKHLKCLPIHRRLPRFLQQLVGLWKMPASKKSSMSRKRRRMHRLQDMMELLEGKKTQAWKHKYNKRSKNVHLNHVYTDAVYSCSFLLSVGAPQHEDHPFQVAVEPLHHSIRERLPASVFVRVGIVRSDGQHGVEQQHAWWAKSQDGGRVRDLQLYKV